MLENGLTKLLHIENPIIQAPMAGGISTSALVAAVSNNGALGMIAAGYLSPVQLKEQIIEVKQLTEYNFGVNVFVPNDFEINEHEINSANRLLQPFKEQLHIQEENVSIPTKASVLQAYNDQIQVIIDERVPICSFTFGVPSINKIQQLKDAGVILIGTATTVEEAVEIEKLGMDAVVVQGSEAGGHRGNFISNSEESLVGLMSLIPQVVDHVRIPVIAAGGIMDGRGLMASLCLGAKAVQMGTAFLTCVESGAHPVHKKAIIDAKANDTMLTRAFSGKYARGIKNQFMEDMQEHEVSLPNFPIQNTLTQSIRKIASTQNNREFMSLWCGQNSTLAKIQTVEVLIEEVIEKANQINS